MCETRRLQSNPLRLIASSDHVRQRWRHALVVLEIAVTVALMVAAATQVDASRRMLTRDLGLAAESLIIARVENSSGVDTARLLNVVRQVPGVAAAAVATAAPMSMAAASEPVTVALGTAATVAAERIGIGTDYFKTLEVPVRAGRVFSDADLAARSRIVIINETLARQLWPDRDAVSARILIDDAPYEVVGIVAAHASAPLRPASPRFYLPFGREGKPPPRVEIVVRAAHEAAPVVRSVREEVRHLGPTYAVPSVFALREVINAGAGEIMGLAFAMSPLLGIGAFLTASGIFGVLAFAIARRSKELALRVALGANRVSLARLVLANTLTLLAIGALAGVGVTFGVTRFVRAAGGGGSAFDTPGWQAFAVPVLIVLGVGLLATWIPTRRAMAADPARLLRTE
jgi:putative ABC transport system permease protein